MNTGRHRLAVMALVATSAVGTFAALPGRPRADDSPTAGPSKAEFVRLSQELDLKRQPWATIPWRVSVTEARQLAAKERKPIFLVVNTGNCLGWT
jgi:hypothetical protein